MMKKLFLIIEDIAWNIRCKYSLWLFGPYGLSKVIEKMPLRFVIKYLRKYGATVGENCIIDSGFKIHRPNKEIPFKNLIIGNNVYLGHNLLLDLTDQIVFENNTALGAGCQIWTHVGDYNKSLRDPSDYKEKIEPVIIGEGAVCYSKVILNPGVEIGKSSRILALSMVSCNIPEFEVWAGIPAKFLKKRKI